MVKELVKGLRPPPRGEDPTPWRWGVFIAFLIIGGVLAFHIAAGKGMVPYVDGVVHSSELDSIVVRLDGLENKQDTALRLQLATEICRVYQQRNAEEDRETRRVLNEAFNRLQENYAGVNKGNRFLTAECARRE